MTRLRWAVTAAGLMLFAACQLPMLQQLNNKFDPASASYVPPAANIPTGFTVVSGSVTASVSFNGALGAASYNLYTSPTPLTSFTTGTKTAGVTSPANLTPAASGTANYFAVTAIVKGVEAVTASTPTLALGGTPGSSTATILPGVTASGTVAWVSSAPSIATVSAAGLVTGVTTGTTTITGTAGGQTVAQAKVNVGALASAAVPFYSYNGTLTMHGPGWGSGWGNAFAVTTPAFSLAKGDTVTVVISGTSTLSLPSLSVTLTDSAGGFTSVFSSPVFISNIIASTPFGTTSSNTVTTAISTTTGTQIYLSSASPSAQTQDAILNLTKFEFFKDLAAYTPSTGITVSPKTLSLLAGGSTGSLTVIVSPANATVQGATWSSSNTAVATVDANGAVTPVAAGTATITATSPDGGWTDTSNVTVSAYTGPPTPTNLQVSPGDSQAVLAWSASSGATTYNLYYSTSASLATSNGTKIANVTSPYFQTGLMNGTKYYWTVTAANSTVESPGATAINATVAVPPAPKAPIFQFLGQVSSPPTGYGWGDGSSVGVFGSPVSIASGDSLTFVATGVSDTAFAALSMRLSNTGPGTFVDATVASNIPANTPFSGVVFGTATAAASNPTPGITLILRADNTTQSIPANPIVHSLTRLEIFQNLTQYIPVAGITVSPTTATVSSGSPTVSLTATLIPTWATNPNVIWSSSNTGAATVSTGGVVTRAGMGTTTITAKSPDGGWIATCVVTSN